MSSVNYIPPVAVASVPNLEQVTTVGNTTDLGIVAADGSGVTSVLPGLVVGNNAIGQPTFLLVNDVAGGFPGLILYDKNVNGFVGLFTEVLTGNRQIQFPNKDGVLAVTTDIPATPTLSAVLSAGNTAAAAISITGGNEIRSTNVGATKYVEMVSDRVNFNDGANLLTLLTQSLTTNRTITLPNATGTVALTSDIPLSFTQPHIRQTIGGTPTVTLGNAAGGSGRTSSLGAGSSDTAGHIAITTGTLPVANAQLFTLTFTSAFVNKAFVVLLPANQLAAALFAAGNMPTYNYGTSTTTTANFLGNAVPLAAGLTYEFIWIAID